MDYFLKKKFDFLSVDFFFFLRILFHVQIFFLKRKFEFYTDSGFFFKKKI